jgi:UDP-2,3-diacylglucosamine hydrolase
LEFVWRNIRKKNKLISGDEDITFLGEDKEWLILYSKKTETKHYNYLIFDRHLPMKVSVGENSSMSILAMD